MKDYLKNKNNAGLYIYSETFMPNLQVSCSAPVYVTLVLVVLVNIQNFASNLQYVSIMNAVVQNTLWIQTSFWRVVFRVSDTVCLWWKNRVTKHFWLNVRIKAKTYCPTWHLKNSKSNVHRFSQIKEVISSFLVRQVPSLLLQLIEIFSFAVAIYLLCVRKRCLPCNTFNNLKVKTVILNTNIIIRINKDVMDTNIRLYWRKKYSFSHSFLKIASFTGLSFKTFIESFRLAVMEYGFEMLYKQIVLFYVQICSFAGNLQYHVFNISADL